MSITCHQLIERHADSWKQATIHPFLQACQSGEIQPKQFNTWLIQDYLFVIEFTRLLAKTLGNAPAEHFDVLLGGLSAIKDELNWFQVKAKERNLNLTVEKQQTCQAYCEYMQKVGEMSYPVQATVIWAIELAYNQAWQQPGAMVPPYNEFAERWGNTGFTEYVKQLEKQANQALAEVDQETSKYLESAFVKIASLEKDFWQMAYNN
ncbi:MAG: TenA family transcriptional regulator [Cyanobacteria bacterium]|jgi:thiaminase/transcriptional activator TenA|nr:TenA family transcriptional regulator [Cyanobacteria bacterium GSL.Bin21]